MGKNNGEGSLKDWRDYLVDSAIVESRLEDDPFVGREGREKGEVSPFSPVGDEQEIIILASPLSIT